MKILLSFFVISIIFYSPLALAQEKINSVQDRKKQSVSSNFDDPLNFSFTDTVNTAVKLSIKDCETLAEANPAFSLSFQNKKECLFSRDSHVWGEVKKGKLILQRETGGDCAFEGTTKHFGSVVIAEQKNSKSEGVCTIVIARTGVRTVDVNTNNCAEFCSGDARMDTQAILN